MAKKEEEQQKLVDLFHNRAELKKEFITLRQERADLTERLEEQERIGKRAEAELVALEDLLGNPVAGQNALVFYHLRGLWKSCHAQLVNFGGILHKQQLDRQRKNQIMQFNQDRERRLSDVNAEVFKVKADTDDIKRVIEALEIRLNDLGGFWHYFKRRSLGARIDQENRNLSLSREEIEALFDKRIKLESEQWPEDAGIGIKGKRAVNLALIAYAQHLYIHFSDHDLSTLARHAMSRRPSDIEYGTKADCEYLMERISVAIEQVETDRDYAIEIRSRIEEMMTVVQYKDEESTVPIAASIPTIGLTVGNTGFTRTVSDLPSEVNVLADNYWDIETVIVQ